MAHLFIELLFVVCLVVSAASIIHDLLRTPE